MKCLNLIHRHGKTLLPLLAFFLLPIFSLGFSSESASAASPISVEFTKQEFFNFSGNLFPDCDDSCLSQYSYLRIDFLNMPYDSNYRSTGFTPVAYTNNNSSYEFFNVRPFGTTIYNFEYVSGRVFSKNGYFATTQNYSIRFTLLDSLFPTGSLSITENGIYDVSSYAEAVVEVPDTETIIQGDYHDDLVDIKNIALVAISVALFICFGRLILGMFMGVRR